MLENILASGGTFAFGYQNRPPAPLGQFGCAGHILFSNDRDKNINTSIPMVDLGGWQGEHKRMVALQPSGALVPHRGGPSSGSQALHGQMMPRQIRSPFVSSKTTKVEESWRRSLEREAKWELAPSPFP